jgi:tetratricopeptide (TPR) repeat protein
MNRSERRRQEAQQGIGHHGGLTAVRSYLDQGKAHQQAGRLVEAEQAYRQVLALAPQHADALHLLGLVYYRLNRLAGALECLSSAIQQQPASAVYRFNYGVVAQKASSLEEAIAAYRKAIELNPRYIEAHINLGNALREQGQLEESISSYRAALGLNPSLAETHNNLGVALKEQGQTNDAIASYRRALELRPGHVEAFNNLGLALMETGTLRDAIASFQEALRIMPRYEKALYNLGIAWSWAGDDTKAVECLQQVAKAKHDHGKPVTDQCIYRSRLKHDIEQIAYLLDRHCVGDVQRGYLRELERLLDEIGPSNAPTNRAAIDPAKLAGIAPSFNRLLHCHPPARLAQHAVSQTLDVAAIEAAYLAKQPEVTFVDGLLTNEALEALRRFCWEATIWKKDYENGYSGAFLGDGFASALLFQIAEELRLKFPKIFKQHRLTQAWAFKHDSTRRGLNIHADAAAVNVNFWITPDEANLNPDQGGLVVYDKEAPREWNFKDYNSDRNKPKILTWLREVGAQAIRIPYRANRAIIFNSDLFHETDEIVFKDEYLSRRINITLLYGYRHRV